MSRMEHFIHALEGTGDITPALRVVIEAFRPARRKQINPKRNRPRRGQPTKEETEETRRIECSNAFTWPTRTRRGGSVRVRVSASVPATGAMKTTCTTRAGNRVRQSNKFPQRYPPPPLRTLRMSGQIKTTGGLPRF